MEAVKRLASLTDWTKACLVLGVARVSAYRFWKREADPSGSRERMKPERALSEEERRHVLARIIHEICGTSFRSGKLHIRCSIIVNNALRAPDYAHYE